jgi:hypothetical protein
MDFILYAPADEEQFADGLAPQEQMHNEYPQPQQFSQAPLSSYPAAAQQPLHYNGHGPSNFYHNGNATSYTPPLQPLQVTGVQTPPEVPSIQQWRGPSPWSPIRGTGANFDSLADTTHPPDRGYSDKIEEELNDLHNKAKETSSGDEETHKNKRPRRKKARRGRGTRSRGRETDRDGRDRGGGGNGYEIRA